MNQPSKNSSIQHQTDFLIVGSGIAGLSYAYKVAEHFFNIKKQVKITIITKVDEDESNTKYAQGGIAAVIKNSDSFESHIKDTLVAGDGFCNEKVVRTVVEEAPERIQELIEWGTNFDKNEFGEFDLAKEGGHSDYRILHHKDLTGNEIERALIKKVENHPYITILNHHFAIDIITQHHLGIKVTRQSPDKKCFGVYVFDRKTNKIEVLLSKITLLATGGIGQAYKSTTNPTVATGDGIAMAYRAKALIENMEFVQFHPTSLYNPSDNPAFLISEAVRGAGGILRNHFGEAFMIHYDARKDLAPRDVVARSIDAEMKKYGKKHVFLDTTHIEKEKLTSHFPTIYNKCLSIGIDISKKMIPVVPAAHYVCGGIKVDLNSKTSIHNLYASGECTSTGLHGANRLASNSLLEALVFSHRAFLCSINEIDSIEFQTGIPFWNDEGTTIPNEEILVSQTKTELQTILSDYVGIVRSDERLGRALSRLKLIYEESEELYKKSTISVAICELRNLRSIAYLITKAAIEQTSNVGLHYNINNTSK
ncbi:MAG: L-aspartate oxidase [Flavobacteriales bacterium]|nr:L-aspartate oxidase [Flavobacteriales bacterium]